MDARHHDAADDDAFDHGLHQHLVVRIREIGGAGGSCGVGGAIGGNDGLHGSGKGIPVIGRNVQHGREGPRAGAFPAILAAARTAHGKPGAGKGPPQQGKRRFPRGQPLAHAKGAQGRYVQIVIRGKPLQGVGLGSERQYTAPCVFTIAHYAPRTMLIVVAPTSPEGPLRAKSTARACRLAQAVVLPTRLYAALQSAFHAYILPPRSLPPRKSPARPEGSPGPCTRPIPA